MSARSHKGAFRAEARIDGEKVHVGIFDTKEEALAEAERVKAAGVAPPKRTGTTLAQLASRLGVKHGTVKRWATEGMAGLIRSKRTGLVVDVDMDAAEAWALEHRAKSCAFNRKSHVYFARCEATGEIKIGWSKEVAERIASISIKEGRPTKLLAAIPGDKTTEAGFHRMFAECRIGETEWFHPSRKLVAFVSALAKVAA